MCVVAEDARESSRENIIWTLDVLSLFEVSPSLLEADAEGSHTASSFLMDLLGRGVDLRCGACGKRMALC